MSIFNNYGGTVGGAIKKNKLFYFISFDGTGQRQGGTATYTVPTAAFKRGDFSGISTVIYNPATGNADGSGRLPYAGNLVPIDPIAAKIQAYYPDPESDDQRFQ